MFLFHRASRRKWRHWDFCKETLIAEIARKKGEIKQESISIYRGPSFKKNKSIIILPGKEMVYSACNVWLLTRPSGKQSASLIGSTTQEHIFKMFLVLGHPDFLW